MSATLSHANHLIAVFDDHPAAVTACRALSALGVPDADLHLLRGDEGARRLDRDGHAGRWLRLSRLSAWFSADQSTDVAVYDAAIRDGRTVLAVHIGDRDAKPAVVAAVLGAGGHFLNFYGRLQTEEVSRWRGPELVRPPLLPR